MNNSNENLMRPLWGMIATFFILIFVIYLGVGIHQMQTGVPVGEQILSDKGRELAKKLVSGYVFISNALGQEVSEEVLELTQTVTNPESIQDYTCTTIANQFMNSRLNNVVGRGYTILYFDNVTQISRTDREVRCSGVAWTSQAEKKVSLLAVSDDRGNIYFSIKGK